jgi:hypothetical protein
MDPFLFCLLVAAVVTRVPSAMADAYAARKAADAGEWDYLKDRLARRDARAQRVSDWAERILARRTAKADGQDPKRAGLGTLLKDAYHGACEDALARRTAKRSGEPVVAPTKGGKLSLRDRVTAKLRDVVGRLRDDSGGRHRSTTPEDTVGGERDRLAEGWRDDLDDEGMVLLRDHRCVWALDSGYCGAPVVDPDVVYCEPHVAEYDRVYGPAGHHIADADRTPAPTAGGQPNGSGDSRLPYEPGEAAVDPAVALKFLNICPGCRHEAVEQERPVDGGVEVSCRCGYFLYFVPDLSTPNQSTEGDPMTAPTGAAPAGNATIEDVQTNEAARRAFEQMGEGAAQLQEAAALAEQARAKIAAAAMAAGDGMASMAFDAGATAAVADINDTVHDSTLSKWSETADQIQAAAKKGHGDLEKYRVGEEVVAENNVDARTLAPTAA